MRIVAISDTHNKHHELTRPGSAFTLPGGDVIVHAGDFTGSGKIAEAADFLKWYSGLTQYKARILIAGNHDFLAHQNPEAFQGMLPDNVTYLEDSSIEVDGVTFAGSPWTPVFGQWAFMEDAEQRKARWRKMPTNIDVLITHGPARGVLDRCNNGDSAGDEWLGHAINLRPNIKLHIMGHIHEASGTQRVGSRTAVNASFLDYNYNPRNQPTVIDLDKE